MEINSNIKQINGGVYLVVNPADNEEILFSKLKRIVEAEIAAVQIWDNFSAKTNQVSFIDKVCIICHQKRIPVLVNNQWQLLNLSKADGVHFDEHPEDIDVIRKIVNRKCIMGITVNNDLSLVQWANDNSFDYISFCSIFPSTTSNSCQLVKFETITKARTITQMPIFLAGGIQPENIYQLNNLDYDGVAVVSGIMSADDPFEKANKYLNELKNK
ncbi:MAG: thiamine phosphate synthase [Chitinophagaceae bacterium]